MFENGSVVPGNFEHPLQSWQFASPVLNAFFIATLATILSYQTTAAVHDLILGLRKRPHVTTATDIHAVLLTDEGSIKSIAAAVLRRDWLDRSRFPREIPRGTDIAREPRSVKKRSIAKLFFLVAAAPLLNVAVVIMTLERNREITFAEAKFGGLALGVSEDLSSVQSQDFGFACEVVPFKVKDYQKEAATFLWCSDFYFGDSEGSWLSVGIDPGERVHITIVISGIRYDRIVHSDMLVDEESFRMRQRMSEAMIRALIGFGSRFTSRFCLRNDSNVNEEIRRSDDEAGMRLSRNLSCTQMGHDGVLIVHLAMAFRVRLLETDSFEVVKHADLSADKVEYMRADDLILLETRSSFVGLGTLGVITGCAVLLRMIVKLLTQNDVHDGISSLLLSCLGLEPGTSFFRLTGTVRYDHKHQEGQMAHFGVRNDDLPEVKKFEGGTVGIFDESPEALVEKCVSLSESE